MIALNLQQFEDLLLQRNRTEPVCIITTTDPDMRKGRKDKETGKYPNRFVDADGESLVTKLARRTVFIGADYESCVNRQRERESTPLMPDGSIEYFEAEQLWGGKGQRVNKFVVEHVESLKRYICVKPNAKPDIINGQFYPVVDEVEYRWKATDVPLTESEVAELKTWFPEKKPSTRQETDKPVFWQVITLTNVLQIRIGGEDYSLVEG